MIAILLATEAEAAPLVKLLEARKLADQPFPLYRFDACGGRPGGVIGVGGMGPQAAAAAAEHLVVQRGATTLINAGICGALADGRAPGTVTGVSQALSGDDPSAPAVDCAAWNALPSARLATVAKPVFCPDRRGELAARADVVDMEGFAIAQAVQGHGTRLFMVKGVSDIANHTGKDDIVKNIAWVSQRVAEEVVGGLTRLPATGSGLLRKLLHFTKVEHTLFSMPLLFAGAWLGAGRQWPAWRVLGLIVLAGVGARALGMAMNRILDRSLDALNTRTAGRELARGSLSPGVAYGVAAAGLAMYVASCAALGRICLLLSPAPAVVLIVYSLLKRFTNLCHFGIGLCLGMAPLAAFVAASGTIHFSTEVLLLGLFTFCWISGFDMIYSLQDLACDRETGVHSMAVSLGPRGAQVVAAGVHVVAVGCIAWLWRLVGGGGASGAALVVAVAAFAAAYIQRIPVGTRFFPIGAVASIAGAMVVPLGGLP